MSEPSLHPGTISFVPSKSDAEKAEAYRAEMTEALKPVLDILNRARNDGLIIGWAIGADQFGRVTMPKIDVTKPL